MKARLAWYAVFASIIMFIVAPAFAKTPASSSKPILYVFTYDGCAPCQVFKSDWQKDEIFRASVEKDFQVLFVPEGKAGDSLRSQYKVDLYPTFVVAHPETKAEITRGEGYGGRSGFLDFVKGILIKFVDLFNFRSPPPGYNPQQGLPPGLEGQSLGDRLQQGAGDLAYNYGQQQLYQLQQQREQKEGKDTVYWLIALISGVGGMWYKNRRDAEVSELKAKVLYQSSTQVPRPKLPEEEPVVK